MKRKYISNLRLKYFDYASGYSYFITVCTKNRYHAFGTISRDGFSPFIDEIYDLFFNTMKEVEEKFEGVTIDNYVIMPDHFHVLITNLSEKKIRLGDVIKYIKLKIIKQYGELVKQKKIQPYKNKLLQKNYFEHVVNNEREYNVINDYIDNNPINWYLKRKYQSMKLLQKLKSDNKEDLGGF